MTCHYDDDIYQVDQKTTPKKPILAISLNLRAAARKFQELAKIAIFKAILGLYLNLRAAARKFRHIYHMGIFTWHLGAYIKERVKIIPQKSHYWLHSQIYEPRLVNFRI